MIQTGVLFDNIHSYLDFDLILSSVDIPPAQPKTTYVDVPGADGSVDLTEAHGEVKYADRKITFTFTMNPSGDLSEDAWTAKKTEVSNCLNGRKFKITLDKDPDYYWHGRCTVDDYKSNKKVRQIVVVAVVYPYKLKQATTFVDCYLTESEQTLSISNGRRSVCPSIFVAGSAKVIFNGNTFDFGIGTHKNLNIRFTEGINQVVVSGSSGSYIQFSYQDGDL